MPHGLVFGIDMFWVCCVHLMLGFVFFSFFHRGGNEMLLTHRTGSFVVNVSMGQASLCCVVATPGV